MTNLKLINLLIIPLSIIFMRCNSENNGEYPAGSYQPKVFKVMNFPADSNSIIERPVAVDESKIKKINAGKPIISTIENFSFKTVNFKSAKAGSPAINFPGKNGFILPTQIPLKEHPVLQGATRVNVSKDLSYKETNPFSFASFGKNQGLNSSIVSCLLQDRDGKIWMGTTAGITVYDGHNYTNITNAEGLVNNDVRSIFQDSKGNIWMGTLEGNISKYDGKFFSNFTEKDGLKNSFISAIKEDAKGNIWFGTMGNGIIKYDGHAFTKYTLQQGLVNDTVNTLITDDSGNIWVGTNEGVSKFDGESFKNYFTQKETGNKYVYTLLIDRKRRLWAGSFGGGIKIFDGSSFKVLSTKNGLINDEIFSLLEDREGIIWIGTHYGLSRYDGHTITNFSEKHGLTNANIYCLMQDKAGNIWMGTAGGGALKYDPHSFRNLTESEGLKRNYTFSLFEDHSKRLWIGSWRGGVSVLENNTLKTFTTKEGLPNNDIRSIFQDKNGAYWFATFKGVVKYNGHSFMNFTTKEGLCDNDVNCISSDHKGNLWFGTENGATQYKDHQFTNYFFSKDTKTQVTSILEDKKGNIWFGTSSGVFKYDGKNMNHIGDKSGVMNQQVFQVYEDHKGCLWFASNAGLLKFDGEYVIQFTKDEGLVSTAATGITEDFWGNIWIRSPLGICMLSPAREALFERRVKNNLVLNTDVFFKRFDYFDNFSGFGTSSGAIAETSDHRIWLGTSTGVSIFDPTLETDDSLRPHIAITGIKIANQFINWNKLWLKPDTSFQLDNGISFHNFHFDSLSGFNNLPMGLELHWEDNEITFDCSGITMAQPQNIKYSYKLEGPDSYLNAFTDQASASYGNLIPGKYIFRAKAMGYNGYWSNETVFAFTIKTPYWQTWWFRAIVIILFGMAVFVLTRFIYFYNLHKHRSKLEKEIALQYDRQRISSDLHDEIGSSLSSINIYSNLAKTEANKEPYLESITENVTEVLNKLDDLVWKINPKYDTVQSVINRIMFYTTPLAQAKQMAIQLQVDESVKNLGMDAEIKHNLYLVLKELINNAIKHSGCKTINLAFGYRKKQLKILVKDDGSGIDLLQADKQRNGLTNIMERVKKMNGVIKFNSGSTGTEITIIISVP